MNLKAYLYGYLQKAAEEPEQGSEDFYDLVDSDEKTLKFLKFLNDNPAPNDEQVHAFAEENGYETDDVEGIAYQLATYGAMFAANGRARENKLKVADVDPDELKMGIEVEHEHTTCPYMAKRIALDHLAENKKALLGYYTMLKLMEKIIEKTTNKEQAAKVLDMLGTLVKGE